jgi:putative hemolysin
VVAIEIGILVFLIILNGFLALSELAIVSSRRSRLEAMSRQGNVGATKALELLAEPGRFLSAVQVGITLVGIVAGAFSGATIAERGDALLESFGVRTSLAEPLSYVIVVALITYLSVIVGELIPKQMALQNRERIAAFVATPMQLFARVLNPLITVLDFSARIGLGLLGIKEQAGETVTDEEIKALIAQAERSGSVKPQERAMIAGVMRLADRSVRAVMTPRTAIEWIDLDESPEKLRVMIPQSKRSHLIAVEGGPDHPMGVIMVWEVLSAMVDGKDIELRRFLHRVPVINERMGAVEAFSHLKDSPVDLVFVADEHGTFEGILTTGDIVRTVVAEIIENDDTKPVVAKRRDSSYLIDGLLPIDELIERLSLTIPAERDYHTAAGFVLHELRRLPKVGDVLRYGDWQIEVVDLDGTRIDKLLATRRVRRRRGA